MPRSLRQTKEVSLVRSLPAQWRLDLRKQRAHAYALVGGVPEAQALAGYLERVRKGSPCLPSWDARCGAAGAV